MAEEYTRIMTEIEEHLTNKEDIKFVKEKIEEIYLLFLDKIDKLVDNYETRLEHIVQNQKKLTDKMEKLENSVTKMEKDIYEENMYDFEVVCPYCNNEFTTDIDDLEEEVQCPECKNIIELDWNGDLENYNGGCEHGCCGHSCEENDEDM